ncbi:DUF4136 domain-containing protein [Massilia horti]|uniref:DUF4136 domain-containing protein n=1 Tax=Massilia horti TaxID=2562153 RepID=A0A4Y9SP56_9BURK|nr:DUF4136 domain-containing protein [Massilia horti]TFW28530.1 DUF4136 domain-containing protein [Massilia horti]
MKRLFTAAGVTLTLLLTGCASTIRSDVTTFQQWPAQLDDKSYAFEAPPAADDTLEMRSYQELVRAQLAKLGFHDSGVNKPALLVSMRFTTTDVPVRVVHQSNPMLYRYMFYSPYTYMYRGRTRFIGTGFYDPFWDPFPSYQVITHHNYHRELKVGIRSAKDGKRLFDVTVRNDSREFATPKVMPALVQSAFVDFPGPNGVARVVTLEEKNG